MKPINREQWLTRAADWITNWYVLNGFEAHYVCASCGWPLGDPRHCAGEVWPPDKAFDGKWYVYVNPILSDSKSVLGVLAHEVAHTIDMKARHRGVFLRAVRAIGLTGVSSMTGEKFEPLADRIIKHLGEYPYKGLNPKWRRPRLVSVYTCTGCGFTAMIPRKYRYSLTGKEATPLCAMPDCSGYKNRMMFKEEARI